MDPGPESRAEKVFAEALEIPQEKRRELLERRCKGDAALRMRVEGLLQAHEMGQGVFGTEGVPKRIREVLNAAVDGAPTERNSRDMSGKAISHYRLVEKIGEGGMGEVYRARDPRLGREVAIKILPPVYSADPDRLARFKQEARAASKLDHPNILVIHDIGIHEGAPYVVSELLEGETFAERLASGAIPVRKAVEYALQILHGLAAAHEKGIVHRDLKPANLFLTRDGRVKILDFGLAKLVQVEDGSTVTHVHAETEPGAVLGTVGYMSPEQVRGHPADHRSDIFSFGCVLYELFSGRRAFSGGSGVEIMNAILREDPPELGTMNPNVSPVLARAVRHCLEKDAAERFQSTRDLAFQLEIQGLQSVVEPPGAPAATIRPRTRPRERLAWVAAVSSLLGALTFGFLFLTHRAEPARRVVSSINPPEGSSFSFIRGPMALSPDGRQIAFIARNAEGKILLWVRALDAAAARPLPGTEGASCPFWSPDGRYLGYFAQRTLKKVEVSDGVPETLTDVPVVPAGPLGASWCRDGTILFTAGSPSRILRIPTVGGGSSPVMEPDPFGPSSNHRWPVFLPDGRHFLFTSVGLAGDQPDGIYVSAMDSNEHKLLTTSVSNAAYSLGYLLFVRDGVLRAQRFDIESLELEEESIQLVEAIQYYADRGCGLFSVSDNGLLVYQSAGNAGLSDLVWVDRKGNEIGSVAPPAIYFTPRLSHDGRRVAVDISEPVNARGDIWLFDLARKVSERFTFDSANESAPVWSADDSRLFFFTTVSSGLDLYSKDVAGTGEKELLLASDTAQLPIDCSRDGRFLFFDSRVTDVSHSDIWVLSLADRTASPWLATPFEEGNARLSPDGRWLAYASDESGIPEVYVQSFPHPGRKWRISTAGGTMSAWRGDGKELFYLSPDRQMMSVEVRAGATFECDAPKQLFEARVRPVRLTQYDVSSDGKRFLLNRMVGEEGRTPITLDQNWLLGLRR